MDTHVGHAGRWALGLLLVTLAAGASAQTLRVDHEQVKRWNRFADALLALHHSQLQRYRTIHAERVGGYANHPEFYLERRFVDVASGRLLGVLRWERAHPDRLHSIEVYEYDPDGTLRRDYLAAYLPEHRNAPIQTLINVHRQGEGLAAYRQFDASGERIYEQCRGQWRGEAVMVSIEQDQLPLHTGEPPADVGEALYAACFAPLPADVDLRLARLLEQAPQAKAADADAMAFRMELLDGLIAIDPRDAGLYLERGRYHFQSNDFAAAIADLDQAIALDPALDPAWFWRGMARGRIGDVRAAIGDLSVYLTRHPDDSLALTKRGVRHIWLGDLDSARADLERAVELDPANAEAHDDLGVVHARQGRYDVARDHFMLAIGHDPSYHKAYHNLAMIHYLSGEHQAALQRVDHALTLAPGSRDALLLKAAILQAQGREAEALAVAEQAEFLPEGNWSEQLPVR